MTEKCTFTLEFDPPVLAKAKSSANSYSFRFHSLDNQTLTIGKIFKFASF